MYVIVTAVIDHYEKDQITPELAREILAKEKDFYEELTNVEKGKQGKGE